VRTLCTLLAAFFCTACTQTMDRATPWAFDEQGRYQYAKSRARANAESVEEPHSANSAKNASSAPTRQPVLEDTDTYLERINGWPLFYHQGPVTSILWPIGEVTDDTWAFRPLIACYDEHTRYDILWPLISIDTEHRRKHRDAYYLLFNYKDNDDWTLFPLVWKRPETLVIFPLFWQENNGWTLFPLLWKTSDSFTIFPFYWQKNEQHEDKTETGYIQTPLYSHTWDGEERKNIVWPLLSGNWNEKNQSGFFTPLYYQNTASSPEEKEGTPKTHAGIPPLLSGWWREKEASGFFTPLLYHNSTFEVGTGELSNNTGVPPLLTFWGEKPQKKEGYCFSPILYRHQGDEETFMALWPLLSGWKSSAEGSSLFTPLYYQKNQVSPNEPHTLLEHKAGIWPLLTFWQETPPDESGWFFSLLGWREWSKEKQNTILWPLIAGWWSSLCDDGFFTLPLYQNNLFTTEKQEGLRERNAGIWPLLTFWGEEPPREASYCFSPFFYHHREKENTTTVLPPLLTGWKETPEKSNFISPLCVQLDQLQTNDQGEKEVQERKTFLVPLLTFWQNNKAEESGKVLSLLGYRRWEKEDRRTILWSALLAWGGEQDRDFFYSIPYCRSSESHSDKEGLRETCTTQILPPLAVAWQQKPEAQSGWLFSPLLYRDWEKDQASTLLWPMVVGAWEGENNRGFFSPLYYQSSVFDPKKKDEILTQDKGLPPLLTFWGEEPPREAGYFFSPLFYRSAEKENTITMLPPLLTGWKDNPAEKQGIFLSPLGWKTWEGDQANTVLWPLLAGWCASSQDFSFLSLLYYQFDQNSVEQTEGGESEVKLKEHKAGIPPLLTFWKENLSGESGWLFSLLGWRAWDAKQNKTVLWSLISSWWSKKGDYYYSIPGEHGFFTPLFFQDTHFELIFKTNAEGQTLTQDTGLPLLLTFWGKTPLSEADYLYSPLFCQKAEKKKSLTVLPPLLSGVWSEVCKDGFFTPLLFRHRCFVSTTAEKPYDSNTGIPALLTFWNSHSEGKEGSLFTPLGYRSWDEEDRFTLLWPLLTGWKETPFRSSFFSLPYYQFDQNSVVPKEGGESEKKLAERKAGILPLLVFWEKRPEFDNGWLFTLLGWRKWQEETSSTILWPLISAWWEEKGGNGFFTPLCYRDQKNIKYQEKEALRTETVLPLLLSGWKEDPGVSETNILFPLVAWHQEPTLNSERVLPFYWHSQKTAWQHPEQILSTTLGILPFYLEWKSDLNTAWHSQVIRIFPPILSWTYSYEPSSSSSEFSEHKNHFLLSALAWGTDVSSPEYSTQFFRLFPIYFYNRDNDTSDHFSLPLLTKVKYTPHSWSASALLLFDEETENDGQDKMVTQQINVPIIPLLYHSSVKPDDHRQIFLSFLAASFDNQKGQRMEYLFPFFHHHTEPMNATPAGKVNTTNNVVNEPLQQKELAQIRETSPTTTPQTGPEKIRDEYCLLYLFPEVIDLYDHVSEPRATKNDPNLTQPYVLNRFLWRVFYDKTVGDTRAVDFFPFGTYDSGKDRLSWSWLWRLLRYENNPKETRIYGFFIPIWNNQKAPPTENEIHP